MLRCVWFPLRFRYVAKGACAYIVDSAKPASYVGAPIAVKFTRFFFFVPATWAGGGVITHNYVLSFGLLQMIPAVLGRGVTIVTLLLRLPA